MNITRLLLLYCLSITLNAFSLTPEQQTEIATFLKTSPNTWNRDTALTYLKQIHNDIPTTSIKDKIKLTNYQTQLTTDPNGLLKNNFGKSFNNLTLTISEDPTTMWHEFISLRDAAQRCAQNKACTHLFVIGTGTQKEITSNKPADATWVDFLAQKIFGAPDLYSHWFNLVVQQKNNKRTYIVADSNSPEETVMVDRRNDPRVIRIIKIFEALIHLYS